MNYIYSTSSIRSPVLEIFCIYLGETSNDVLAFNIITIVNNDALFAERNPPPTAAVAQNAMLKPIYCPYSRASIGLGSSAVAKIR
jgi:hypothetical protein